MTNIEYNFDFVNFTDNNVSKVIINTDKDTYDNNTIEHYRMMRILKIDPIMEEEIPKHLLFEFKYKWNPLSGERLDIHEVGPLCFNALNLYEYYFKNRHNGLWIPPADQYQGYYGNLLGSGQNIKINSRGNNPEKYLYRLPIIDCYLTKNHNHSTITMGPILTNEEIDKIDELIKYVKTHKPTLKELKSCYDNAINNNPNITELKKSFQYLSDKELCEKYNRSFVDTLIKYS